MGLLDKVTQTKKLQEVAFSKEDVELLLVLIKNSQFKGSELERVYGVVYKLQQYYMQITKK